MTNMDCASLGSTGECKLKTSSGSGLYTGGYCTLPCQTSTQCGAGQCVSFPPTVGEGDRICLKRCDAANPCRTPGYACYQLGTFGGACWISPLPGADAGP